MATLVITDGGAVHTQNCSNVNGGANIGLNSTDLPGVADTAHLQVAETFSLDQTHDLTVAEAYHLQVVDHLYEGFGEHVHIASAPYVDPPYIDDVYPNRLMTLPVIELNRGVLFATGVHINGPYSGYEGSNLPFPQLTAYTGAVTSDPVYGGLLKLGDLRCEATASAELLANLDAQASLPELRGSARAGAHAVNMKLPELRLSITLVGDLIAKLDRTLPGFVLSATASTPILATLDGKLPVPTLNITDDIAFTASLSAKLPPLKISATDNSLAYGATLDAKLPVIRFETDAAASMHTEDMSVDVYLPTLVMATVATGLARDGYSEAAYGREVGRFTDYELRHTR